MAEAQEEQSRIAHQENNDLPRMLFLCAMHLRSQIKSMRDTLPWLPAPGNLTEENVRIPTDLFNMLAWLIAGDLDMGAISGDRVETLPMHA